MDVIELVQMVVSLNDALVYHLQWRVLHNPSHSYPLGNIR